MTNDASELDIAATAVVASPTGREAIERRRRVAFLLCECARAVGVPLGGCLRDEALFRGWLDDILQGALTSGGKIEPRRYRVIWAVRKAMGRA